MLEKNCIKHASFYDKAIQFYLIETYTKMKFFQ